MLFSSPHPQSWSTLATFALVGVCLLTACDKESEPAAAPATTFGQTVLVGSGAARTYVTSDAGGAPTEMGIRLTAAALDGLPTAAMLYELPMPAAAVKMPFDHVSFSWNPGGQAPMAVYGAPHFDAHFYRQPRAGRNAITLDDPKGDLFPPAAMLPEGYQYTVANGVVGRCVAKLGRRWTDPASPEYQPGGRFSSTLAYGTYEGHVTFLAPMFTRALLTPAVNFSAPIKQPLGYAGAGKYYPARYALRYEASTQEYVLALSDLFQIPAPLLP
ncbi:DUF5602 domain-containing protein [Hymenobacter sp. HD11105]